MESMHIRNMQLFFTARYFENTQVPCAWINVNLRTKSIQSSLSLVWQCFHRKWANRSNSNITHYSHAEQTMMRGDFIADRYDSKQQLYGNVMYESDEGFDYLDDCDSQKLLPPYTTNGVNNFSSSSGQYHRNTGAAVASATSHCIAERPLSAYTYNLMSRRSNKRYTPWAILTVILILLVMVYIPLSSNVSTRIGNVCES